MISAMVKQSCTSANSMSLGPDAGHLVGLFGRSLDGAEGGDVVFAVERHEVGGLRDAEHLAPACW